MDQYEKHRGADRVLSDTSSSINGFERQLCQFMNRGRPGFLGARSQGGMEGSLPPPPIVALRVGSGQLDNPEGRVFYFSIFIHSCENHMHAKLAAFRV